MEMDIESSINILTSVSTPDAVLAEWLHQVSENIYFLKENENVVNLILKLQWTERSELVCQRYQELVLNLVTACDFYVKLVLKMIIRHFTPVSEDKDVGVNPHVHNILRCICELAPSSRQLLLAMIADSYPYMKKGVIFQTCYLKNMLRLTSYLPAYRSAVMEIVISKLLQMDVHCPRDVILEAEDFDEPGDDETIFEMEGEGVRVEPEHQLAKCLDVLINEVYEYVHTTCYSSNPPDSPTKKLDWESTKNIYKELLTIFDTFILPTYASAHVQFVMFYICSFRSPLCEGFVDYLWKKVQNPNVSPIIRQASVCYLGSYLARARYVPIRMVQDCLTLMCSWVNHYIDNQSETSYIGYVHHSVFYAVCQVVFYLVTFRHKEMVFNKKGRQLILNLNLERIVKCHLNPLRFCLPVVAKNFASMARNHQIAYCYTVIERNNRMFLPGNSDMSDSELSNFNALEMFFPFDPYLLKKSGRFIQPLYREYEDGHKEVQQVNEDKASVPDGSPTFDSLPSQQFLPDLLHCASSPGYMQHNFVSPKFR